MKKVNVAIITLGCSKNEIDSDIMAGILKNNDFNIITNLDEAEIIIVNTCGFIDAAKEESIKIIWEMTKYKEYGKCKYLILSGCLAERYSKELAEEIDEVDGILGTGNIRDIAQLLKGLEQKNKIINIGNVNEEYIEEIERTEFTHTAYMKISEGCNNYCTYCIIPKLRGHYRSRKMGNIISEAKYLVDKGVKEIILIAQNTTDYGIDLYGEYKLPDLLYELNKIEGLEWIRILYMYPDNFTDELIEAIKTNKKVAKYVDIPIQHISDKILEKMNRKTSKKDITKLIKKLRSEIPEIIIRTTVIVGFPGEKNEEFDELYEYIKEIKFDRLGAFVYSREEGTKAYEYDEQIDEETKIYRRNRIMELQQEISLMENKNKIGKIYKVLIEEKYDDNIYIGRSYMDSPEIDGIVYFKSIKAVNPGTFVNVKIVGCLEYDLMGEILSEYSE
ncbi:30S ribosomal protein S12 methylthiotransferase RimO [Sporanaerobacter acetigenes]|uniref:Ribosomal protein uS12 methylthiotransferase RimO n=1 Tax=Sporanaerobacter acetigenes DSM 13106 TaxID=1123281 RepID=A0A1M5XK55_9FIRM|nr:30S ribosomal protein S12 methylthiotransferase RimO [Sporanaerobacter acetigenes]SHI00200.1 ribosomal protein S12 methylthiotransferase [Sporanaerobacter acetigenes DSM 13106]